jgi:hypothetical protein
MYQIHPALCVRWAPDFAEGDTRVSVVGRDEVGVLGRSRRVLEVVAKWVK